MYQIAKEEDFWAFFNKKRSDGVYVKSREAYSMLMPFIMPKRTESLVYYETSVDIANVRGDLHKRRREGETLSFFSLINCSRCSKPL